MLRMHVMWRGRTAAHAHGLIVTSASLQTHTAVRYNFSSARPRVCVSKTGTCCARDGQAGAATGAKGTRARGAPEGSVVVGGAGIARDRAGGPGICQCD